MGGDMPEAGGPPEVVTGLGDEDEDIRRIMQLVDSWRAGAVRAEDMVEGVEEALRSRRARETGSAVLSSDDMVDLSAMTRNASEADVHRDNVSLSAAEIILRLMNG